MMLDNNLNFSNGQTLTTTAASTNVIDLLFGVTVTTTYTYPGSGAGNASWGPNATFFGQDFGVGQGVGTPRVVVSTGNTAYTNGTSLQIQFQGAPDSAGAAGTVSSLTFTTYLQTDTIALALLTASQRIASFDWPMRKIGLALPRFVRLNYVIVGTMATAKITSDVTLGPDDATGTLGQYPSGFTVAA